ncbi:MAG: GC-type dockerin domain-anchored protein [Phycisphaerales bacterium JB060]
MQNRWTLARSATILATAGLAASASAQCTVSRQGMPDFDQRRHTLPNNGDMYCVPAATVNALAYLSNHGLPHLLDGPRDWESPDNYALVSGWIELFGATMDTDPFEGTSMGDWHDSVRDWVADKSDSIVVSYYAKGHQGLSPLSLANQMRGGAVVMPLVGWYDEVDPNQWERAGGHLMTMWAALNACGDPQDMVLAYRDPWTGDPIIEQSPFTFVLSGFEYDPDWRFRINGESEFYARPVMRLASNNGFLDGYGMIWPLFGLTTDPFTGDISLVVPEPPTDDPGPKAFQMAPVAPGAEIVGMGVGTLPTQGFVLTRPVGGAVGTLHTAHYLDGELTAVADIVNPRGLVVGRNNEAYVSTSNSLLRFDLQADGSHAQTGLARLPSAADAMHYDDRTDEVLILSLAERRITRVGSDMAIAGAHDVPAAVALLGDGSITTDPNDFSVLIASTGSPEIARLELDRITGEFELLGQSTLPGVAAPASIQMGDNGSLYAGEAGVIRAFKPARVGAWEADAGSPMDGQPSGPMFVIGRGRTNFEPEMADINVVPPAVVEGQEDCRADLDLDGELTIFDFLAFQNLFDGGSTTADFDFDGELTLFDFLAFQNAFDMGC